MIVNHDYTGKKTITNRKRNTFIIVSHEFRQITQGRKQCYKLDRKGSTDIIVNHNEYSGKKTNTYTDIGQGNTQKADHNDCSGKQIQVGRGAPT